MPSFSQALIFAELVFVSNPRWNTELYLFEWSCRSLRPQHCILNFQGCYQYLLNLINITTIKLINTHRQPNLGGKSQVLHCILDLFQKVKINYFSPMNEQGDPPLAETIINNVQNIGRNSSSSECFLTVCNRQLATLSSRAITTPCSRAVTTNIGTEHGFQ